MSTDENGAIQTIHFNISEIIDAGETLIFRVLYDFIFKAESDTGVVDCPLDDVLYYGISISGNHVTATPDVNPPGVKEPVLPQRLYSPFLSVACVGNINTGDGFTSIQEGIDDLLTEDGHVLEVCPGIYHENVLVDKSLTIRSKKGSNYTIVESKNDDDPVFYIQASNTTIQGFTLQGAEGSHGILTEFGLTARDMIIQNNGMGGIFGDMGFYFQKGSGSNDNDEHVLAVEDQEDLILEDIKITDNDSSGIYYYYGLGHVILRGTANRIINNGGHGIRTEVSETSGAGDVIIEGTGTEINDNGELGILSAGSVTIRENAMSGIYRNGKGGIEVWDDVSLPSGFEIKGNGGHGLSAGNDIDLIFKNITIAENDSNGIYSIFCTGNVILRGTASKIINNGGHGIWTMPLTVGQGGEVIIEGTGIEIHDNGGWGIFSWGSVTVRENAMSGIYNNGQGGIFGDLGISLPPQFEVHNNGGTGIVSFNTLRFTGVKVHDNQGHGIYTFFGDIVLDGDGTEILHNDRSGVFIQEEGDIVIHGSQPVIALNGEFGLLTLNGDIIIHTSALVNANKKGGVVSYCKNVEAKNLQVTGNEGEGVYAWEDVTIHNGIISHNQGHGILVGNNLSLYESTVSDNTLGGIAFIQEKFGPHLLASMDLNENNMTFQEAIVLKEGDSFSERSVAHLGGMDLYLRRLQALHKTPHELISKHLAITLRHRILTGIDDDSAFLDHSTIFGNRIASNQGGGIYFDGDSKVTISSNNIFDNTGFGLYNTNSEVSIDARINWWGDGSGPGGTGQGSGDAVTGNVIFDNWLEIPVSLVLGVEADTLYIPKGSADSVLCHVQNWANLNDVIHFNAVDTLNWVTAIREESVTLQDSMGGETMIFIDVPIDPPEACLEYRVDLSATSGGNDTLTVWDAIVIRAYEPAIQRIMVTPDSTALFPGDRVQFTATGLDQRDREVLFAPEWSSSAGSIDDTGSFVADSTSPIVLISARDPVTQVRGQARVRVMTEARTLTSIGVSPDTVNLLQGQAQLFRAIGYDQNGLSMMFSPRWESTGGTVDSKGYYIAGNQAGTYAVTAFDQSGTIAGTAVVYIATKTEVHNDHHRLPTEFRLHQNVPNPFNPETTIRFQLPSPAQVILAIFNLHGQKIGTLLEEKKEAGYYGAVWDGRDDRGVLAASGVYLYKMEVRTDKDHFVETRKMIFLR